MRYLRLENDIIPIINIRNIKRHLEEEDGTLYEHTIIYFKDGSTIEVEEDFDSVCALLNPIPE